MQQIWLRLGALAAAAGAAAALPARDAAAADDARLQATATMGVFGDEAVQVLSPAVSARWNAGAGGTVSARAHVDVVSGATIAYKSDLVTSATRFAERRQDLILGWQSEAGERDWGAGVAISGENDFRSVAGNMRGAIEVWDRRSRLEATGGASVEQMLVPGEAEPWRDLHSFHGELRATTILRASLVWIVSAHGRRHSCDAAVGCAASPYRAVTLLWADGDRTSARERHPATRLRGALSSTLSWAPWQGGGLHLSGSAHADDWGVASWEAGLVAAADLRGGRWQVRLEGLHSRHSKASFFRAIDRVEAGAMPAWRSADRRLGGMQTSQLGAEASVALPTPRWLGGLRALGHFAWQWNRYEGFANAMGLQARMAGVGIEVQR